MLVAGSKGYLQKVKAAAEPYKADLLARCVSLILLPLDVADPDVRLRALKQQFKCGTEALGGWGVLKKNWKYFTGYCDVESCDGRTIGLESMLKPKEPEKIN